MNEDMRKRAGLWSLLLVLGLWVHAPAQDTFSIVAVDPATGEVGSAGATCLDVVQEGASAVIISDILPGKGVIHTQSYWNATNQSNARLRMLAGDSPQQIINWLIVNDAQGAPSFRQYGIVDLDLQGEPRAAAFTGSNCLDFKTDLTGTYYAIQGNILLGPEVVNAMEALFLSTQGSLSDRLMAAMQGAKVPGADSRCLDEGVSSRSAFLRVARPDDEPADLYLDLRVDATSFGVEPIDSLQNLYDTWLLTSAGEIYGQPALVSVSPNPATGRINVRLPENGAFLLEAYTASGQRVWSRPVAGSEDLHLPLEAGLYILVIRNAAGRLLFSERYFWIP